MILKKAVLILMLMLALVARFALHAGSPMQKEILVQSGQKLEVNLRSGGNISILGWKENKVRVKVIYANGNTNASEDCKVTLSDITKLIDAVYISKTPPAACMASCEQE